MTRLLGWLDHLPSWLRAGVVTGTFVAVPGFIASMVDVVNDVASWAAGTSVDLPDLSALRAAAVAVVAGAITGGLNAAYRWAQEVLARRRGEPVGNPPIYPSRKAHS